MLPASLQLAAGSRVLLIGSHSDDIEIGCGGAVLTLLERHPSLEVTWVVLSGDEARAAEARAAAAAFCAGAERAPEVVLGTFRDGFFPYVGAEVKDFFEALQRRVAPDVIFTHVAHDLHQDHRLACELTWNTFRDHLILEYEIPKFDGDLRSPNVFVPLAEDVLARKVELLLEHFPSQRSHHWFTADLFHGLARVRGVESGSPTGFAEGFQCRKLVLTS